MTNGGSSSRSGGYHNKEKNFSDTCNYKHSNYDRNGETVRADDDFSPEGMRRSIESLQARCSRLEEENHRLRQHKGGGFDFHEDKCEEEKRDKRQAQSIHARKMQSVVRLAGGVAHDYNNMMQVIMGTAEMAQEQVERGSQIFNDLEVIRRAARHSAGITRQLLAFARKQPIAPRILNLNEIIEGVMQMLQRLIGSDKSLLWRPGPELHQVRVDPGHIEQVLINLCVNARDAIIGTGEIIVATANVALDEKACTDFTEAVPGDYVRLTVRDKGQGMDEKTLEQLFEPFFTTKKTGQGTGLGLSTVYGIADQNEGFVTAESEPGNGSAISVYLPRYKEGE